jgi:uncharacterized protein (DUF3084 family)
MRPPEITEPRERKEIQMFRTKIAAFVAALILAGSSTASAQSGQAALKAPPHMTRARLIVWCRNHPKAVADCKEVRADTRELRSDRKEVRTDRRDLKSDIKAGDKREAKTDRKELKADRKDIRVDRKDKRQDARDVRKDGHR